MRVIKGKNQYALVVSKDELRYITACVGAAVPEEIKHRIKKYPQHYGSDKPLGDLRDNEIFEGLKEHIPNKVEGKCF